MCEFQTIQLLPAKNHNPYQSTQGTPKAMSIRNDDAKTFFLIRPLTPLHLLNLFPSLALTLFITLKGWGTGVPHLAGLTSTSAHIILHRHTYIDKGWGTGVPHLANSTK